MCSAESVRGRAGRARAVGAGHAARRAVQKMSTGPPRIERLASLRGKPRARLREGLSFRGQLDSTRRPEKEWSGVPALWLL